MLKSMAKKLISGWLVCYRLPAREKKVALTFDDGPHPEHTEKILGILSQEKIKATFFMTVKEMERHPQLAKRVCEQGHAIGNHGYTHSVIGLANVRHELFDAQESLERIVSKSCRLFRPPHGTLSVWLLFLCKWRGIKLVLWSRDGGDYNEATSEEIRRRLKDIESGDVIVLHDDYRLTPEVLPQLVREIKNKGLEFTTIQADMHPDGPTP